MLTWSWLLFCAMAPIGTLIHELGHVGVARALGYETVLSYGSMTWLEPDQPAPERHEWLIIAGGPVLGLSLGLLGLLWLMRLRAGAARDEPLRAWGWVALLLALFWSRQVFNLGLILAEIATGAAWPGRSDETRLALHFGLPPASLDILLGALGLLICWIAVFRLLPRGFALPVAAGGAAGAFTGYLAWFHWAGPILLP